MKRVRRKLRKLKRFARLPGSDRALTAEAALLLCVARLWLVLVPFEKVAGKLGTSYPASEPNHRVAPMSEEQALLARRVSEAVQRAAKNVPSRAVCIHQAIAAKIMLARRGIASTMHFGVQKGSPASDGMRAHAWLDAADVEITGYGEAAQFTEIAYFV